MTFRLYRAWVRAARQDPAARLAALRRCLARLPVQHQRCLAFLARHLHRLSLLSDCTGMTSRNLALVWAPNLLQSLRQVSSVTRNAP